MGLTGMRTFRPSREILNGCEWRRATFSVSLSFSWQVPCCCGLSRLVIDTDGEVIRIRDLRFAFLTPPKSAARTAPWG